MHLLDISKKELEDKLMSFGEKSYRAKQIFLWIHKENKNVDEMSNISIKIPYQVESVFGMPIGDNGKDELYTFYLTTLGSLDKFLEYTLKPNRKKMHSELGADGEIHVWYSNMQKNLPPALKKDCIKDENLIKELGFHDFDIYDLYK